MKQYQVMLKRCPRDRGDLLFEIDHYGPYWNCLQCGQHYYTNKDNMPIFDFHPLNLTTHRKGSRELVGGYRTVWSKDNYKERTRLWHR